MKKKIGIALLLASAMPTLQAHLALGNSRASQEICDTLEACKSLKARVDARMAEFVKMAVPHLTDFARDEKGQILNLNQYSAEKYCRAKGKRLPTARELAMVAQPLLDLDFFC